MKAIKSLLLSLCLITPLMGSATEYNNAVKVTFLSWITGSTKLSYERVLGHHQTGELCASVIGAGFDKFGNQPLGYTLRYGHKFFISGNEGGGLKGLYLRPEFIYSTYNYNQSLTGERTLARMSTLLATAGYQTHYGRFSSMHGQAQVPPSALQPRQATTTALPYGMSSAPKATISP